jgi:hypothetical protein
MRRTRGGTNLLTHVTEKLPKGAPLDAVQCPGFEPDRVGGAQGETAGAVPISLDAGREGFGIVRCENDFGKHGV